MMLTQAQLKEKLVYDENTGLFMWKYKPAGNCKDGWFGGAKSSNGYLNICVNAKIYLAHRLAWLYITGEWPLATIDHKNGDPYDNRFTNLRDISHCGNTQNLRKPPRTNTSSYLGVHWKEKQKQWVAQISYKGVRKYLGGFSTPEEAYAVYLREKEKHHEGYLK